MEYNKYLEAVVTTTPLALLTIKNLKDISIINDYLPYSTGFEIECMQGKHYNVDNFKKIPDILDVINDTSEQRYRIPSGIKGFMCLYNISEQLQINSELNSLSGIHYHVDMTDCFNIITKEFILKNRDWIIKELETWNYKGTYNSKGINHNNISIGDAGNWARFSHHSTLEFRIGEMTFDYKVLVKRIIHCNSIVKRIKDLLGVEYKPLKPEPLDTKQLIEYIRSSSLSNIKKSNLYNKFISNIKELKDSEIQESSSEDIDLERIKNLISNRNQNK